MPRKRSYIPNDLTGTVILNFLDESSSDEQEVRAVLYKEIAGWLAQFRQDYRQYGLLADDMGYEPELIFPFEVAVLHVGVGSRKSSRRDNWEAHMVTIDRTPEGLHERLYRYTCTLDKQEDDRVA